MKANELRLGNLFIEENTKEIISVVGLEKDKVIFSGMFLDKWQSKPIQLTKEILLQLGFEYYKPLDHYRIVINDVWYSIKLEYNIEGCLFTFVNLNCDETKEMPWIIVDYVHELQNLYFALTKLELNL